jgi:hypothetical protein
MDSRKLRRQFMAGMGDGLGVVWPILSILLSHDGRFGDRNQHP